MRWQQQGHIAKADASGETRQDIGEIVCGVHTSQATATEDRECDGGTVATGVGAGEVEILSCERGTDMQPLNGAVVWRHLARFEEAAKRNLVIGEVSNCSTKQRRWWFVRLVRFAPVAELCEDRQASLLARNESLLTWEIGEPRIRSDRSSCKQRSEVPRAYRQHRAPSRSSGVRACCNHTR